MQLLCLGDYNYCGKNNIFIFFDTYYDFCDKMCKV